MTPISFTLTETDFLDAWRFSFFRTLKERRIRLAIFMALILVALALTTPLSGPTPFWVGIAFRMAMAAVVWAVVTGALYGLGRFAARQLYRRDRSLQGEMRAAWTDEALTLTWDEGHVTLDWRDLNDIAADDRSILLYHYAGTYRLLPKRALTPDQATAILSHRPETRRGAR